MVFMNIPKPGQAVPHLTTAEMIEVDRAMMEDYHIELIQMMENAGRNLAHLARIRFLDGDPRDRQVLVLAGTGGNGGGALVAARRLHNWGARVDVITTRMGDAFTPVPGHQLDILRRMGVATRTADEELPPGVPDLVIDGIIGYSLKGTPRGSAARLIRLANSSGAPVLALDTPSGMDAGTGAVNDPVIRAAATLTLALPKDGLFAPQMEAYTGELYLADISVPPDLYGSPSLGLSVPALFSKSEILRLK
jgi:NAD(P)H-hydrate epimerase